jgi:hypothetical protein
MALDRRLETGIGMGGAGALDSQTGDYEIATARGIRVIGQHVLRRLGGAAGWRSDGEQRGEAKGSTEPFHDPPPIGIFDGTTGPRR